MKKIVSLALALIMTLTLVCPAFAENTEEPKKDKIPIVYLRGDGNEIYDVNGNIAFPVSFDSSELPGKVARVIFPHFINAVLFGKWEEYYDAFEAEVEPIFAAGALDENGNPTNGSDISAASYNLNIENMNTDKVDEDGEYWLYDYTFWYDWRRDPLETADLLHEYITTLKKTTGVEKVALVGKCLGGSFVLAYLSKYGYNDIRSLAFDATVGNGNEKFSETYGGKILFDGEAFERSLIDDMYYNADTTDKYLADFILATVDLLNESGVCKVTAELVDFVYKKLYEGLTPRLGLAVYGTWPGYWSSATVEDYPTAKKLVFGEEGSENYVKYKGLIEKLDRYDREVRQRIPEILLGAKAAGVNVGILAKYGYQMMPLIESCDELGDTLVTLKKASFGATCSKVYNTLSDEYIAERVEKGYGKYISPDKQVDASTCLFPDYTWIVKGVHHDTWAADDDQIIYNICTYDGQYTVNTDSYYPQFMIYNDEDGYFYPMTEDNHNVTNWDAEEVEEHTPENFFKAFINAIKAFFELIKREISEKFER